MPRMNIRLLWMNKIDALLQVSSTESTVLMGDFNAHVGIDTDTRKGVIGKHGVTGLNENGRYLLPELESRPKSSRPRRDFDLARPRRDRDFEQKLETRPRHERSETETRHETFETKRFQYFSNVFETKFWTIGELCNTLQYRFLGISLLY